MRWRQIVNPETGKSEFVPLDEAAARQGRRTPSIQGDIESFVSPVDGSVISDRKQLREHNKRHNVVNTEEFSGLWEQKAKERARFYNGEHTKEEKLRRKQEIWERFQQAERN